MPEQPKISGFTLVRNAQKLEYPFRESVLSALPLCDEFIINAGDSGDGTDEICRALVSESGGKVRLIHSKWERSGQTGGYQLKAHTDRALAECRHEWCLYIQADEVLHEEDYPLIREALAAAKDDERVDGVLFDYLHFYANYSYYMTGRNWYRRETRLLRNHRGIESFRDAQGFRKDGKRLKVLRSKARVFHYGHVRTRAGLHAKTQEMTQWWGEKPQTREENLIPYRHFGLKRFTGTHPTVMRKLTARNHEFYDPMARPRRLDKRELKNMLTLAWETVFRFRIGEFKNYQILSQSPKR